MNTFRVKAPLVYTAAASCCSLVPLLTQAGDAAGGAKTFSQILSRDIMPILTSAINLMTIVTFLVFVWGVLRFIQGAGDDKRRAEERKFLMWGTIALFLMVSVWGVVKIVHTLFFGSS